MYGVDLLGGPSRNCLTIILNTYNLELKSRQAMKGFIQNKYPNVSNKLARQIYRDYIFAILNGEQKFSIADFRAGVLLSSRIHKDEDKFLGGVGYLIYPGSGSLGTLLDVGEWYQDEYYQRDTRPGKQFQLTLDEQSNVIYSFASDLGVVKDVKIEQTKLDLGFGDDWDVRRLRYNVDSRFDPKRSAYKIGITAKNSRHDAILEVWKYGQTVPAVAQLII